MAKTATTITRMWTVSCNHRYISVYSHPHDPTHFKWTYGLDRAWLMAREEWLTMGWPEEMLIQIETVINSYIVSD